jgi:glyoxylase-like metal-dependent hydrolase (beta-lactamase superfamily II)
MRWLSTSSCRFSVMDSPWASFVRSTGPVSSRIDFVTLDSDAFEYGGVDEIAPHVRRVIAKNPSKFTYHGTGTYIIGRGDVAVVDPGPTLDAHRDALAAALDGETVRSILVTHCHADHSPLAAWLRAESGAPTIAFGPHDRPGAATWDIGTDPEGFGVAPIPDEDAVGSDDTGAVHQAEVREIEEVKIEESTDHDFVPDHSVETGDLAALGDGWSVTALHTPGHTSNHTCFALDADGVRTLFTGDHVMGWSTTVVSPPDGDMAAYFESLRVVAGRSDDVAIPTHGAPIPNPQTYVRQLIAHREDRERQIVDAVRRGLTTIPDMVTELYAAVRVELHKPASRSVLAHLVKLVDDGVIVLNGRGRPRLDSVFAAV